MKKGMFNERYGLETAVLERWKTMTRRIAKELNHPLITDISEWGIDKKGKCYLTVTYSTGLTADVYPHYQIGEEVAVAQSYKEIGLTFISPPDAQWGCTYEMSGYSNKMFVRADLMPHRFKITDIKVERLQDISEEDCLREGIYEVYPYKDSNPNDKLKSYQFIDKKSEYGYYQLSPIRDIFAVLIDRISGKGTWERNPWVFAYTFELIK